MTKRVGYNSTADTLLSNRRRIVLAERPSKAEIQQSQQDCANSLTCRIHDLLLRSKHDEVNCCFHYIPLREAALFVANAPIFDDIRADTFRTAWSDAALETLIAAAEAYGDPSRLDAFMLELLASPSAGDVARALTMAGLRTPNDLSADILAREFAPGFLRRALHAARKNYARDSWARHWMKLASTADDSVTF